MWGDTSTAPWLALSNPEPPTTHTRTRALWRGKESVCSPSLYVTRALSHARGGMVQGQGALLAALARASGASSSINAVPVNSKGRCAPGGFSATDETHVAARISAHRVIGL
jgi:hypothetical protein